MPKITVVLTSFNHAKFIRETIDSVIDQTFSDFELVIWDDASTDDSWAIINSYSDPRIKAFRNEVTMRGVYGINKAISEVATGEYIAIHHSDDVWELDKLEKQVACLDAHSEVGAVFTNAKPINELSVPLNDSSHFYSNIFNQPNRSRYEWLRYFFLNGNALCHPSVLVRKSCYDECGLYRIGFGQLGDFDMWVRLCAKYEIHVLSEKLIKFRIRDGEMNTSGNRPIVHIRDANEKYKILQQYREISSKEDIFKIFPEFKSYDRGVDTDSEYVLARVCIGSDAFFLRQKLAIDILFDILNNPVRKQAVEQVYGFTSIDFIEITGRCDIYSRQAVASLQSAIVERDAQMDRFLKEIDEQIKIFVADRDDQLSRLSNKIAEQEEQIIKLLDQVATSK